ncbi:Na(+)/H(+) exchange regulatory cofactor NHE-RF2-like [Sinocyclocheilus anshuiensis]|uniref:Na(+)/H(+) exchange regulatory cofactor NHE-RF2-like n=1 Tax=Sinocyclocheilus anshuiensis TaxID=1608454 RepID=UPI0007B9AE5A|nr:PREDICTED: Na(+)/H(+) exchange regulatory cofactor NHE-RF2-like [Sinocyclocheilus anshuiensis]
MANTLEREILERELRPRLCYLTKGDRGYGFHLHGERNRGAQLIRRIEPGSPADLSGLRSGDRVVEVNGENVEGETHQQVVQRILEVEYRTRLLVVDRVTDEFLKFHGLPCTEDRAIEMGSLSSRSSAASSPRASPRDSATPPYSRQSSEGIFINKSPSSAGGVMNGSPLYRAHARLASPCERKTEPEAEPFTKVTAKPEPECELSTDLSGSQTSTQEETALEEDVVLKDLRPRSCHMTIGEQGYGFNLHCKKSRVGQFIRSVDPDSPAERVGLRPRDRLIEVNDRSVEGLRHAEVVALIRAGGTDTRLLVVDPDTDELFNRLRIVPTSIHLKEDCVDGPIIESPGTTYPSAHSPVSSSLVPDTPKISPPIINITLTEPPISNGSPRHQNSDHLSSDDAPKPKPDVNSEERPLDPFWESGLHLSLTAAEAKQKARAKRPNKRAPPMDWSKKQEIFGNF